MLRAPQVGKREVIAGEGFRAAGFRGVAIPADAQAAGDRRAGHALGAGTRVSATAGPRCSRGDSRDVALALRRVLS